MSKAATQAQKRRFIDLQMVGCICCRLNGQAGDARPEPADIHHLVIGGRRLGHDYTIPLCPWHHRGINVSAWSSQDLEMMRGPSLARSKCEFVARYGSEMDLLELTNRHLERLKARAA